MCLVGAGNVAVRHVDDDLLLVSEVEILVQLEVSEQLVHAGTQRQSLRTGGIKLTTKKV